MSVLEEAWEAKNAGRFTEAAEKFREAASFHSEPHQSTGRYELERLAIICKDEAVKRKVIQ